MAMLGAAGWILPASVRAPGATNYLDGARDFNELAQRIEKECRQCIRRDENGAVVDITAIWGHR